MKVTQVANIIYFNNNYQNVKRMIHLHRAHDKVTKEVKHHAKQ